MAKRRKRKSGSSGNSLGQTDNFKKASTLPAKTVAIKTVTLGLKPLNYNTNR